jgi:hypothetical protein
MRALPRWQLMLGLVLTGVTGAAQKPAAHSLDTQASFTVHFRNHAEVDSKQLAEAERVAAAIFTKAGVGSSWVETDDVSESQNSNSVDQNRTSPSHIYVCILSQSLADFGLSKNALGLAPGSGPHRQFAYVFYDRVKELARKQLIAQFGGTISEHASLSQILGEAIISKILGEVIAHEIGHILLNLPSHSQTGIMRGHWDLKDLHEASYGSLLFTLPQAEVIRAEAIRRAN